MFYKHNYDNHTQKTTQVWNVYENIAYIAID